MNENTGNLKPLQIINPMTGRKIFVGTKTYKDLQNQGMIPKDVSFNPKKLGKAEPMFKVMNKPSGAEPKSVHPKTKSKTVESESSSEDDEEDALEKILAKSKSVSSKSSKKTKMKRPPTPQPSSSESESESESSEYSESDSDD